MDADLITERIGAAFNELAEINNKVDSLSVSLQQGTIKEGSIYLKLKKHSGTIYSTWAVVLFSKQTNRAMFSKELGVKLTKAKIKKARNGRRLQELMHVNKQLMDLLKRRQALTGALKACDARLRGLYPEVKIKAPLKKESRVSFI